MSITFNADEIFEMAEEIERNGASLYREVAQKTVDKETKKMLLEMAAMEDEHLNTFKQTRKELGPQEKSQMVFDPDNQAALYLQTMAADHGTEGKKNVTEKLTGSETITDILKIALNAEKDSVVFYFGLKESISARAGRNKVEAIIREELGHIAALNQKLAALR